MASQFALRQGLDRKLFGLLRDFKNGKLITVVRWSEICSADRDIEEFNASTYVGDDVV